MNQASGLVIQLLIGAAGGIIGWRTRLPGGVLVGAMAAVIILRIFSSQDMPVPKSYGFIVQILVGVMVGATYTHEVGQMLLSAWRPVIISTLALVGVGLLLSLLFVKTGLMDFPTAYLSTSPGAMSALVPVAVDSQTHPPVVAAFHFFRVLFILAVAPFLLKLFQLIRG